MKIVVDAQLPYAAERFGRLGHVEALTAAEMTQAALRDADALIVRSVTRVDEALLGGTRVRFVGSATSGTDHVDLAWLRRAGIAFADAAGCNATAVAEYVVAALLHLRAFHGLPRIASLGIVGFGHVGRRVHRYAHLLGMPCFVHDPPLAQGAAEKFFYRSLDVILRCDVITLHVPLERGGAHPTVHMVDDDFLSAMKPNSALINTARGAVVDTEALKRALRAKRLTAVLDVWENEPRVDPELVGLAAISTPHIAGHTLDAKRRSVDMLYAAAREHFERPASAADDPPEEGPALRVEISGSIPADWETAVRAAFDVARVSEEFRAESARGDRARAAAFEATRSATPARREFHATEVVLDATHPSAEGLEEFGFRVARRTPVAAGSEVRR